MDEEHIKLLLSEYDYNKNDIDDTMEFLLRMCWAIANLERR